MSRVVRERLLEIIDLLEEASKTIEEETDIVESQAYMGLLTDTQNLAIALGTRIEKLKGIGTQTVRELEKYCECLYWMSERSVTQEQEVSMVSLQEQMREIQKAFDLDFPDKLEVVFLPYKASMWDSLESVWMAADEDENCEAYVIPIPYYTLDESHNFKDFYYEGTQYPDYVPITDYKEYDLELHHPDVIYVHNPYDEFNTVTSIAPEFYLKKIKDYTDKLVYIPYFVLQEIEPSNQTLIDSMSHFCFLPGTMYADQVIVQSENMRQIYINEYIKAAEERNLKVDRAEIEKKFLGIGSPKYDKVTRTKKEDVHIPEEWLQIIRKPDGSYKKVIFYNTSVYALLNSDGNKMIEKMKNVFQTFWQYRDEVALLWRPHPLIKDTIETMLPQLREEYQSLVQGYRHANWGIYDDSSDLERAIAISDAYYGDVSSVVQLCQKAGMPVMIQNVDILD